MIANELPCDDFRREKLAKNIVKALISKTDISPLLLNGAWGTGKTVLAKRIESEIQTNNSEVRCIYINAFQEDHVDNALITLIAAVARILPDKDQVKLISKAKPAIRYGIKTISKAVVSHVIKKDFDSVADEFKGALQDLSSNTIDYSIDNILSDHIKSKDNIDNLIAMLESISQDRKIIIIIDELDRCNPNYAIDLIEKIKHIFDLDNIRFLLTANWKQLESSIQNRYGNNDIKENYLDKFIKYTIEMPEYFSTSNNKYQVSSYFFDQGIRDSIYINGIQESKIMKETAQLIVLNKISIREVESFLRNISLYEELRDEEIRNLHPITLSLNLTFIFIYTFSSKFGISHADIMLDPSVIYKIKGLELQYKPQMAYNQLICRAITHYKRDQFDEQYISDSDSESDEILTSIKKISPNNFGGSPNYLSKLSEVFNTLSFL